MGRRATALSSRAGSRVFAVDCTPLDRRRVWLATGLPHPPDRSSGIAVVLSDEKAHTVQVAGLAHTIDGLSAGHCLVATAVAAGPSRIEALVFDAYGAAMA